MRTSRRFRPSFEYMSARIAPSSGAVGDPTAAGSAPDTTPIINPDDLTTAPTAGDANLLIIAPTTSSPVSTVC
jgi:hypothetical protein